jgi:hypothetical protein
MAKCGEKSELKRKFSLQFDPAPRAGEPMVSRRVPDYFLVSRGPCFLLSARGTRKAWNCIQRGDRQLTEDDPGSDWLSADVAEVVETCEEWVPTPVLQLRLRLRVQSRGKSGALGTMDWQEGK